MGYKQELQSKQNEVKDLLKSLKKQRTKAKKEKADKQSLLTLDRKIEKLASDVIRYSPSKYELYKLSNGKIVNLKILKAFLKRLKGANFVAFQELEDSLVVGYSSNGRQVNGKFTLYAFEDGFFTSLHNIPYFSKEDWF